MYDVCVCVVICRFPSAVALPRQIAPGRVSTPLPLNAIEPMKVILSTRLLSHPAYIYRVHSRYFAAGARARDCAPEGE